MRPVLMILLLLGGCAMGGQYTTCPTLIPYSQNNRNSLVKELTEHPELQQIPRWLNDYIGLRAQIRACEQQK